MIGVETLLALLAAHGLLLVAILAVIEGPIVSVVAALLAARGIFDLWWVLAVVITADIAGDIIFYVIGRRGTKALPARWRDRLGLRPERLETLTEHFRSQGGRTLVIGKLTHSAGLPVLVAAGAARMPVVPFLLYNFLATVPKSLFFVGLGYFAGTAYERIDTWISLGSLIALAVILLGVAIWLYHRRTSHRSG